MPSGNTSLYLDIYIKGQRKLEYLRLYLTPEHNREDRQRNAETLRLAEAIRAKRVVEVRNGTYGFRDAAGEDMRLFDLLDQKIEMSGKTDSLWGTLRNHLRRYETHSTITVRSITQQWAEGFVKYIDAKDYSENTKWIYFTRMRTLFNLAIKKDIIQRNPFENIQPFRKHTGTRQYLTIEELRQLVATKMPPAYDAIRKAFIFSCLTGIRWSDITRLRWSNIYRQGKYTRIMFEQKKTREREYLDISEQAAHIIEECRGLSKDLIFADLSVHNTETVRLGKWVKKAGIDKHITFHCARHTFAVMMLDLGTDIYTVSKLLGHTDVGTTQIYAKVLDRKKQEAVDAIPDILVD